MPVQSKLVLPAVAVSAVTIAAATLYVRRNRKPRWQLERELREAMTKVEELTARLDELSAESPTEERPEVRIFLDGSFDMMHYGHMNAFRQARSLGTRLVVGIDSAKEIETCKGMPPVMNDEERILAVKGCKFVDEIVEECPYAMSDEYVKYLVEEHHIDFIVHGDDPCIVNGKHAYEAAMKAGKFISIPRTEGVSTTDIVGRMLLLTKAHHDQPPTQQLASRTTRSGSTTDATTPLAIQSASRLFTTSRMIRLFSQDHKDPPKGAKIVYLDGGFDMIHAGHMELIQSARKLGDYLIVGLHNDSAVNTNLGGNLPIMTLNERVLSVLGCHCVDDVLIDAPWAITSELIASLNISVVAHGHCENGDQLFEENPATEGEADRHAVPKQLGMYQVVSTSHTISVRDIVSRIQANEERYRARFDRKMKAETEYYQQRYKGTLVGATQ